MTRHTVMVVIAVLVLVSVPALACSQKAPYSDLDVLGAFIDITKTQTLPDRKEIWFAWSNQILLGKVKYIEESIFQVEFPDMELDGTELWAVDMEAAEVWPGNGAALRSAIVLFCKDSDDRTGDCESYFRSVDRLKESLDS